MIPDLRVALRSLSKKPAYFAIASLTLAVGVGANTAVFSLFEAVVLRRLPVERPGELAVLGQGAIGIVSRSDRPSTEVFSFAQYEALKGHTNGLVADVAAAPTFPATVYLGESDGTGTELQRASCMLVSGSYFPLFGVRPFLGRLLGPEDDDAPGANPVAVLSHAFWSAQMGADPGVVGSTIRLHGEPYTIVGVTTPSFKGHVVEADFDIWAPLSMQPSVTRSPSKLQPAVPIETYWLNIFVRLRYARSFEEAEAAINLRLQQLFLDQAGSEISDEQREYLEELRVPLTPMDRGLSRLRQVSERPLGLLWGATALVLLVACANIGNLLLVRAAERRQEFGVRRALGALRGDLLRPLFAESLIIAAAGTGLGCLLAILLVPLLQSLMTSRFGGDAIDARIAVPELALAAGVGAATVLLFGLAPAAWTARRVSADHLKADRSGGPTGRTERRGRGLLVAGQCALALVLLTTAGLILKTLTHLRAEDLGMDAGAAVGISLDPQGGGFAPSGQPEMRRRIVDRVAGTPGVESVAFTGSLPLRGNYGMRTISVSGYEPGQDEEMNVIHVWASPSYFDTLGIRILQGRSPAYGEADSVVVNEAFSTRYFGAATAVGGIIDGKRRIVGVVGDVRHLNVRDRPPPIVYQNTSGHEGFVRTLVVRSSVAPRRVAEAVRGAVLEVAPGMPVARRFDTVALHLDQAVAFERMLATLVGAFALCALFLSTLGLFGVCSHMVRNRTVEIGVRMALGADRCSVQALVFRQAAIMMAIGCVAGVLGALGSGRFVSGLLYQVRPFEWGVVVLATLALALCVVVAATVPALQAGRTSPAEAVRGE